VTDIAFHFNVPDKLQYACRLLRKGVNSGARLTVTGPQSVLQELDTRLWTFSALDFVPHVFNDGTDQQVRRSPVLLAEQPVPGQSHPWLVNLGDAVPDGFDQFERLIELVAQSDDDRQSARMRWKHYSDSGYKLARFDVASAGA
jgi:DNA polymerase-3 subunit chi